VLHTPVTWESWTCLRTKIEQGSTLDSPTKHHFQKLANATEKAFADRTILLDENRLLFEQNNEKTTRQSVKSTIPGNARIMTYDDIVEAEQKRAAKVGKLEQGRNEAGGVPKARSLVKGKDRAQMSWRLATLKLRCSVWRSIVLFSDFNFVNFVYSHRSAVIKYHRPFYESSILFI
jgi:hypothetical protein